MIKKLVKQKTFFAILMFCPMSQGTYAYQTERDCAVSQLSEYVNNGQETPLDTLTNEEKRRIEELKRDEYIKQQNETQVSDLLKAQEIERYAQDIKTHSIYKQSNINEKGYSSNDERAVVFGIRAGVNFASSGLNSELHGKCSMVTSFHAGLNLDIRLINHLHLNTSLLFSQKGYNYENGWDRERHETVKAQFLMLPVQLSYRIGAFQINAGPYLEYGLGGEIVYGIRGSEYGVFDYYDRLNYGLVVGLGLNLGKHFYVGGNYEFGLGNFDSGLEGYANRNIAVSLGINF